MTEEQRWMAIPGWEGWYEVSDQGSVRSVDRVLVGPSGRRRRFTGRVLRTFTSAWGYPELKLMRHGQRSNCTVHQLVLLAFVGPRPEGLVTRHLNGDPADNRLTNLAYGTPTENMHDRTRHGNCRNANKTLCPQGHAYSGPNLRVNPSGARVCRTCMSATARRYRLKRKVS